MIMRYTMQLETYSDEVVARMDVDGDGDIDSIDALILMRYTMGLR